MNAIIWILAYTGLFAIAIGTANFIFKWNDACSQRKQATEKHRTAVLDSLKRIEAGIANSNKAPR
jgi:hypothetical protein